SRKGFVHRLLGKIKITEQADQSCQDSSRIHAIKRVEQFAYLLAGTRGHDTLGHEDDLSKPATPNQFGKGRIDEVEGWLKAVTEDKLEAQGMFLELLFRGGKTAEPDPVKNLEKTAPATGLVQ
ncbi:MAG: hypothetical protein WBQ35_21450, partial [Candidatus Sulfotelmatobacter sp.]